MEQCCGKRSIGACLKGIVKVLRRSAPARCDDGNIHSLCNLGNQSIIKPGFCAIRIHGSDQQLPCAKKRRLFCPGDGVYAGIDAPAVDIDMIATLNPLGIDSANNAMRAEFLGGL